MTSPHNRQVNGFKFVLSFSLNITFVIFFIFTLVITNWAVNSSLPTLVAPVQKGSGRERVGRVLLNKTVWRKAIRESLQTSLSNWTDLNFFFAQIKNNVSNIPDHFHRFSGLLCFQSGATLVFQCIPWRFASPTPSWFIPGSGVWQSSFKTSTDSGWHWFWLWFNEHVWWSRQYWTFKIAEISWSTHWTANWTLCWRFYGHESRLGTCTSSTRKSISRRESSRTTFFQRFDVFLRQQRRPWS